MGNGLEGREGRRKQGNVSLNCIDTEEEKVEVDAKEEEAKEEEAKSSRHGDC